MVDSQYPGVVVQEETVRGFNVSRVCVTSRQAAAALGRSVGEYVTIQTGQLWELVEPRKVGDCFAVYLRKYLRRYYGKNLLICGLGNQELLEDSFGPRTAREIPAHILDGMDLRPRFSSVAVLAPGTFGQTNIDPLTDLTAMVKATNVACVLAIEACATESLDRLAATIQVSAGHLRIAGSGVLLARETLGVPVIGIRVPFVMPVELGGIREYIIKEGISAELDIAVRIVSYAATHMAYPKMGRRNLWMVLGRM